jgi:O-antigen/teichoic acid export membrane protein
MMLSGTVIAQILAIIVLPYFQKYIYNPDDFALFTWFFELTAIFVGISALRLETGIVLERNPSMAIKLLLLCLGLVFISSLVYTVLVVVLALFVTNFSVLLNDIWLLCFFPITIFFTGGLQVLAAYYTRQQLFKQQATNKVMQSVLTIVPQYAMGKSGFQHVGLIGGKVIGAVGGFVGLWWRIKKEMKQISFPIKKERKEFYSKHKNLIRFTTPSTFIGMFVNFIFIDLFLHFYGDDLTGQLGASKHYIGMGFSVLSTSFAQVFYGRIAAINNKVQLRSLYTYWLIRLSIVSLLIVVTVWLVPNSWMVSFLGEKWSQLMPVMRILSLWMGVMFVTSSLSFIYIKLNRQKTTIIIDIIHLIVVAASIIISYSLYQDFYITLYWFTGVKMVIYVVAILLAYYFIEQHEYTNDEELGKVEVGN